MKTKANYVLVFVAVAMFALGVTAWAKTYAFQATSIVPGADELFEAPPNFPRVGFGRIQNGHYGPLCRGLTQSAYRYVESL